MKFRMIWLGPEDDPDGHKFVSDGSADVREAGSRVLYERRGGEMVRRKPSRSGSVELIPLANFVARILKDIIYDEDIGRREFSLEAELAGQKTSFVVSAAEFSRMNWVLRELGPRAIIYPGQQQQARAAIQYLSGNIQREHMFSHLGWVRRGQDWMYLHGGGALGVAGNHAECDVRLPGPLQHYRICLPTEDDRAAAVRASLSLLSVAPDRITLPLLAAVYRAPFGGNDFSVFLTGQTGTFKTALAVLCQQHFGATLDASCLPANFASTANALEELAFSAKDALLVVDDFAPTGGGGDSALQAVAERLFRSTGNHQGRLRMDGTRLLAGARPPRALILATGEELPNGHSVRARLLILALHPGEVDQVRLSKSQATGQQGAFANAMGSYVAWIAGRFEQMQQRLQTRAAQVRAQLLADSIPIHARLPATLAELQAGWEIWLRFAVEVGAITHAAEQQLQQRAWKTWKEVASAQAQYHQASDPAFRFLALLRAALARGSAHIADRHGRAPQSPEQWGWHKPRGRTWMPLGTRIGWLAADSLYLEPTISYEVAQQMTGSERLPVSIQTLRRRLHGHGLLSSTDTCRQTLLVRRVLQGAHREVLHLQPRNLVRPSAEQ